MGIIDDYYGGYENLALFTNYETGEVDMESAFNYANFGEGFVFPNYDDSDEFEDEEEKAEFYRIIGAVTRDQELPRRNGGSTSRGAGRQAGSQGAGHRHGRGGGRNTAAMSGQQLFSGLCSSCGQQCTVPFRPVQGRAPPCCRRCHAGSSRAGGAAAQASGVRYAGGA